MTSRFCVQWVIPRELNLNATSKMRRQMVDKKEKKHRCRCDGSLLGHPPRKKYELIVCHIFRFVTGVLNVSLEGPWTGRIESGTVRKP